MAGTARKQRRKVSLKALTAWHAANYDDLDKLGKKLRDLTAEVLEDNGEKVQGVSHRPKELPRFIAKADRLRVSDPSEVYDACGIRVITYFETEMRRVAEVLRDLFEWDESAITDKTGELGRDKVGYRAIHLIGRIPASRAAQRDWAKYRGHQFEYK